MKQEDSIIKKYGKDSGMTVPDGYFADLQAKIMESLPEYKNQPAVIPQSRWQRMKPYVYLAAMFCGIWLMMKLFHTVSQPLSLSLDNPPEALVQLLERDTDYDYFQLMGEVSDYAIEEEVIMNYDSFEDFERDFEEGE